MSLEEYADFQAARGHPPKPGKRILRPEQEACAMLVEWIDLIVLPDGTRPGLYFAHCPNGGARSAIEGAILKGQGVRKGWPDYTLYLPRGGYHGLVLEMKAEDGDKPDEEQLDILRRLSEQGFKACVAWGFDQGRAVFEEYLGLAAMKAK